MKRLAACIAGVWLLFFRAAGQNAQPEFQTAEIRPSAHLWNPTMQGGLLGAGRYELHQATLLDLIATAWRVDPERVMGGPSWLDRDRFDVIAQAPHAVSRPAVLLMLQRLLTERFKLVMHNDTRSMPAWVLGVGQSKPKLKEAEDSDAAGCQVRRSGGSGSNGIPSLTAACRNVTMQAFASELRELAPEYVEYPVVDDTGLKAAWDFDLSWSPKGPLAEGRGGISLPDAIEKQLGLHFQSRAISLPVLVIDSVSAAPLAEPPKRPAPRLAFDVAAIRPSPSDTRPTPPDLRRILPGGRVYWKGVPLRDLIAQAWDLDPDPHAAIPGAPKWLDDARFDLTAEAPAAQGRQLFSEDLRTMLRSLLVDRFRMTTHHEQRLVDVYTLVAAKPKLKKAEAPGRSGCRVERSLPSEKSETGPPPESIICQNISMAEFAARLQSLARSYIRYPVQNGTGIEGKWDFTLTFHPAPPPDGGPPPAIAASAARAADAPMDDLVSRVTLFAAIEKDLGLKLEVHKRLMPVLVIDHIDRQPTDN
ncbi:MAG TPA: TIGR03435 family protein [Bryobacteraceae bacterium]|nr:TIGR03435 family protein [Bryobacteraceae bacterium]